MTDGIRDWARGVRGRATEEESRVYRVSRIFASFCTAYWIQILYFNEF